MNKSTFCLSAALIALAALSCGKVPTEDANYATDRVLSAWIQVNYPGASANDSGVFILSYDEGTGRGISDSGYLFARYVRTDLKGDNVVSNIPDTIDMVSGLDSTTYTGCDIWRVDNGFIPKGIEPILKNMREGGHVRLVLPVGMSGVKTPTYGAFNSSESDNVIYNIWIERSVDDIDRWQDSLLQAFSNKRYSGADSVYDGLYVVRTGFDPDADSLGDEAVVALRYMARRVEDMVMFDTNIRDTARRYGIYSSSSTYDTIGVTVYADIDQMVSSNSLVTGFARACHKIRRGDTLQAFFRSDLGYGAAGSGGKIPGYAPLYFTIIAESATDSDSDSDLSDNDD